MALARLKAEIKHHQGPHCAGLIFSVIMDPLCQIANSFLRLTRFSYRFVLGKKGCKVNIDLRFDCGHFHHLAGFQYLRDIDFIRTAEREAVFLAVLEERITMALLEKSPNFQKILPDRS